MGTSTCVFIGVNNLNGGTLPFFNVTTAGTGARTLTGNLDVNGALNISNTENGIVAGSNTINIAGNYTKATDATFTRNTSTVIFDG
jgi:hypothetical protein